MELDPANDVPEPEPPRPSGGEEPVADAGAAPDSPLTAPSPAADEAQPSSIWRCIWSAVRSAEALWGAAAVCFVSIHTARSAVDTGIRKIHRAGVDGVGVNSLHDGADAIRTAFTTWEAGYTDRLDGFVKYEPVTLATAQTALELALVPFSLVLLWSLAHHVRGRLAGERAAKVMLGSMAAAIGYAVVGVFNQIAELTILQKGRPIGWLADALEVTGSARTAMLVLAVIPLIAASIHLEWRKEPSERFRWWRGTAPSYRVMLIVAALHAVFLLVSIPGEQSADALRLWADSPHLAVTGIAGTALLGLTLAVFAARLGNSEHPVRQVLGPWATVGLTVGGGAVAVIGWIANQDSEPWGPAVLSIGLIGSVVGLLSLPLAQKLPEDLESKISEPTPNAKRYVPAVLAAAPLTVLAVALIRAAVPSIIDEVSSGKLIWAAVITAGLAAAAYPVALGATSYVVSTNTTNSRPYYYAFALVINVAWIVAAAFLVDDPWARGPEFGVIAVMSTFLIGLVAVFALAANFMESRPLPAALDFVGMRRLPVVSLLVIIAVIAQSIADSSYHDVATSPAQRPATSQLTVDAALYSWITHTTTATSDDPTPSEQQGIPLVFVSAAGGGIKAAAFTATALNCVFAPLSETTKPTEPPEAGCATRNTWNDVFMASGASGGSVGIASVMAEYAPAGDRERADDWVVDGLGGDMLSASIVWQLLVETPNAVLAFHPDRDRASVLEQTWRDRFDRAATTAFYVDRSPDTETGRVSWSGPLAFFSGTNLNDGCRVNVSAVRAGLSEPTARTPTAALEANRTRGGSCTDRRKPVNGNSTDQHLPLPDQGDTRDLVDYLCDGSNIDLATAGFLSARFPFVSPTGTVTCDDDEETIAIGDGGYRDNSGASSIMDAWSVLEPIVAEYNFTHDHCIVPILLEIDTGYAGLEAPDPSSNAAQLLAPALGAANVFGDLSYGQIEQAAAEFTRELSPNLEVQLDGQALARHIRLSLIEHPGVIAPLGWSLSNGAITDFSRQLTVEENKQGIARITSVLSGLHDLTCVPAPSPGPTDATPNG